MNKKKEYKTPLVRLKYMRAYYKTAKYKKWRQEYVKKNKQKYKEYYRKFYEKKKKGEDK